MRKLIPQMKKIRNNEVSQDDIIKSMDEIISIVESDSFKLVGTEAEQALDWIV